MEFIYLDLAYLVFSHHKKVKEKSRYRISSYSFRGNYSFLNLEIQRPQYIRPKVTVHKCAETIQGRKLYEEIRYLNKYLFLYEFI